MRLISRTYFVVFLIGAALSMSAQSGWVSANGKTTTTDNVGIGTTNPTHALQVFGKGLFQNTGIGSTLILDRTDGKIAAFGAGGVSTTFAYDDSGIFKIESNSRANIAAGTFGLGSTTRFTIDGSGNVGIGTASPIVRLHVVGNAHFDGTVTGTNIKAHYQDVAEWVPATADLAPGTVVILNRQRNNEVMASVRAYDTTVAGVVSAQPGLSLGIEGEGKEQIATTGRVKVRVDARTHPIEIGDLLVTSDVPGTAMRSEPMNLNDRSFHQPGTIIGKALEPLAGGTGEILVLLSMQ